MVVFCAAWSRIYALLFMSAILTCCSFFFFSSHLHFVFFASAHLSYVGQAISMQLSSSNIILHNYVPEILIGYSRNLHKLSLKHQNIQNPSTKSPSIIPSKPSTQSSTLSKTEIVSSLKFLEFNYDLTSSLGPLNWQYVDISQNEWLKYVDAPKTNLFRTVHNQCNDKRQESPINLIHPDAECTATHKILTGTRKPNQCFFHDLKFTITPSGLRATIPGNDNECVRPRIDLPNGFPFPWVLDWIEIKTRSEHLINGRRYDGELIMAHLGREEHNRHVAFVSVLLDSTTAYYEGDMKLEAYIAQWEVIHYDSYKRCKLPLRSLVKNIEYPKQHDFTSGIRPFLFSLSWFDHSSSMYINGELESY